ncbi:MAG: ATP-binding protein [Flavisolibacter sp.]
MPKHPYAFLFRSPFCAAMIYPKSRHGLRTLPLIAAVLFMLLLIWGSYFRQRSVDKENSILQGVQKNSNLAVAFEQYAIRTLGSADALLQMIRMEYTDGDTLNLNGLMEKNSPGGDLVEGVVIVNAEGEIERANFDLANGVAREQGSNPYFLLHQNNSADSLLVWNPNASKLSGSPAVILSRKLTGDDGRFAGMIALLIRPAAFTNFYAQAHLFPNDILSLIAPDGITYARRTGSLESSGEDISRSPLFVHVAQRPDSFYFAPDAIRGVPTWFSYRRLIDYPIIATIGSAEADVLAEFRSRQTQFIVPRIIISLLVVVISIVLARLLLHRRRIADQLEKEKENYQRLLTEQMIAVQEREREWIGRELHDNVNQVLTTVKLFLETVAGENDHPLVRRSMSLIGSSISDIRHLSHQLSAPTLGTRSLVDSIQALVEDIEASSSIKFSFTHAGYTRPIAMNQKLALYRILQEQLTNIMKHAQASRVAISLFQEEGDVVLTVEDDGRGFDMAGEMKGMGINNMISRARVFDGDVQVCSTPGKGCRLSVQMRAKPFLPEANAMN